jgi:hypothetical protein
LNAKTNPNYYSNANPKIDASAWVSK